MDHSLVTLTTLTDGLFGGIAGALGAFGAAALTIWLTRRADRRREEARIAEKEEQRRQHLIASLMRAFRALESEVRFAPFLGGRTQAELLQFVMLFYYSERAEHPAVAQWVLDRSQGYAAAHEGWRRWWWVPVVRGRRLKMIGEHLGQTLGAITSWASGAISDDWFATREGGRAEPA